MRIFGKRSDDSGTQRRDLLTELERLFRRVIVVPLAAPLLLFVGFGLGDVTNRALELPEATPVSRGTHVPRIQLEALSRRLHTLREAGTHTADYVEMYRDHVAPVEYSLKRRGVAEETARKVAWPLVEQAYERGLDPATVLSVLLIESRGKPSATSPVGARGLMQVMPMHIGQWRGCGTNLYDIEDNICNGTSILAWYYKRFDRDERRALLGYNGCVRGTFTRDCFRYPDKIGRERRQILAEWQRLQARGAIAGAAAAP